MADLSITPASVVKVSGNIKNVTAGGTITAGMPVYLDSATNTYKAASTASATASAAIGIALHGASANQPLTIQTDGVITIGATVAVGTWYGISDVAGAVCPVSDNGAADYGCLLGVAITAANLQIKIQTVGVAHA